MITVEDLTLDHVANADIRMADQMEWLAGINKTVHQHLKEVWPMEYARVALDERGEVLCFWGVDGHPTLKHTGNVWLVATWHAPARAKEIHRHLKPELEAILERYPVLQCWSDKRNTTHHQWLRWLGFKEYGERFWGYLGFPFKFFIREED